MKNRMRKIVLRRLLMSNRVVIIRTHKTDVVNKRRQNVLKDIRNNFLRAMLVNPDEKEIVTEYEPTHADVLNAWLFS